MKLDHYAQIVKAGATVPIVLHELKHPKGPPVLHVQFCGEGNTGWTNAEILNLEAGQDPEEIDLDRQKRHALIEQRLRWQIADHGVVRVANTYDSTGALVDGPTAARALLEAVPRFVLNRIWNLVRDPLVFPREHTDDPIAPAAAVAEK